MELKNLAEAEQEIITLNETLANVQAERDEYQRQSSEKDGIITAKDAEIAEANRRAHEFFLKIPMVDKTEEGNENDEPKEETTEDFAHRISAEF